MSVVADWRKRPMPPMAALEDKAFVADLGCEVWIRRTFIEPDGPLYNEEHDHLRSADIGVLWTSEPNNRHMLSVVGQAEMPQPQGNAWIRGRQKQQLREWFGKDVDFVLTFSAEFAAEASDATWCAVVEHELLHCGQQVGLFGVPKFRKDGLPMYGIRGHDVEEFVTVVRRYGVGHAAGKTAQFVAAAVSEPEIGEAQIVGACGTCGGRLGV